MSAIRRRTLLGLAAGAATARLSFEPSSPVLRARGTELAAAIERARAGGKALLVLVVPPDEARAQESGRLFGRFLSFATDAHLALLATCDFTCAPLAEVTEHADGQVPADAFAVLVETDGHSRGGVLRRKDVEPAEGDPYGHDTHRIADRAGEALRGLLYPDDEAAERRQKQCYGTLGPEARAGIDFFDAGARPKLADVDRCGPLLYRRALMIPAQQELWLERLAYAAAARLWDRDPEGARWEVDPVPAHRPDPCPACGMAVPSAPGRTFLRYYTR